MDVKEYVRRANKEWQDNIETTVRDYTTKQLEMEIAAQIDRIDNNIYCKVATRTKTKKLLKMLLGEAENRQKRNKE